MLLIICILFVQTVDQWTIDNVLEWMASVNIYRYTETFKRYNVDGEKLLMLNESELDVSVDIIVESI